MFGLLRRIRPRGNEPEGEKHSSSLALPILNSSTIKIGPEISAHCPFRVMDSYSDPVTNAQGLLQIALDFSRWIPSLVGGSQGKCSPLPELQGLSKPVRLCNPQDYYWAFFSCVYRNHKNTINKLLNHMSKWSTPAHTVHSNIFSNYSSRDNRNEISKGQSAGCLFIFKSKESYEIKDSRCHFAIREYELDFLNLRGKNIGQIYTCILIISWVL